MANFAIMGFGTVGSGVAEVLRMNGASIAEKLGERLTLKYILDVRDLSASPYASLVVKDFALLESDPELDVVVESIGGAKVAYEFTRRALLAGKHVVTSNKELVAAHGRELLEIARDKNVNYLFEASVGGGIPVLRPLFQCLAGNQIQEIAGILNGTTNYILTRMVEGASPLTRRCGRPRRRATPRPTPPRISRAWTRDERSASCPIWPGAGRSGPRPSASGASADSLWRTWTWPAPWAAGSSCWAGPSGWRTAGRRPMWPPIWCRRAAPCPGWTGCSTPS